MTRCQAIKADGTACRNNTKRGEKFCHLHSCRFSGGGEIHSIEEPGPKAVKLAIYVAILGAVLALLGVIIASIWQNRQAIMIEETREAKRKVQEDFKRALNWAVNGRIESLRGVDLSGQDLSNIDLSGADLRNANLIGTKLNRANLSSTDLEGANLHHALLRTANLRGVNLSYANLSNAYFNEADLEGASLYHATCIETVFQLASLSKANLSEANLTKANLTDAILDQAMMSGSSMNMADMRGAHMAGATIAGGSLVGTDLTDADLYGVAFSGGVVWDSTTKWPNGYIPPVDKYRRNNAATP